MKKIQRIVLADDHPILLKGLTDELKALGYDIVGAELDGLKALAAIIKEKPDVAILDIQMPLMTGFEVIQKCKELDLNTKFLILTSHKEKGIVFKAKTMGVDGYHLKDEPFSEIHNAIMTFEKDKTYFSSVFDFVYDSEIYPELAKIKFLSNSEKMIIKAISEDKSTKDIAQELGVSSRTVEKHRSNIISKLQLSSGSNDLKKWIDENEQLLKF
jgi:DNA-binding NarL/FixJ family response regulator